MRSRSLGAERHDALDLVRLPFLPGAAVQPDLEVLALLAHGTHRLEDRLGADPVRAVRVGQLAGDVDLRRLQRFSRADDVVDVLRMDRRLGDGAGAVETQVHELQLLRRHAAGQRRRPGLGLADQLLDLQHVVASPAGPASCSAGTSCTRSLTRLGLLLVDAEQPVELARRNR